MLRRLIIGLVAAFPICISSACTILITASGKGDIKRSMENRDRIMNEMGPGERSNYIRKQTLETMALGRDLFASVQFGRTDRSCDTCHPNGGSNGLEAEVGGVGVTIPTLIGAATAYPKYSPASDQVISLCQMINTCLVLFMDGRPLDLDSPEMVAITMYVSSLSNGKEITHVSE